MAERKTKIKRLRLTPTASAQLNQYLTDQGLNFSDFINTLISEKLNLFAENSNKKVSNRIKRDPPNIDPKLLFELGKIGNNLNQLAKALNFINYSKDTRLLDEFSFIECLNCLNRIQNDIHLRLAKLPNKREADDVY